MLALQLLNKKKITALIIKAFKFTIFDGKTFTKFLLPAHPKEIKVTLF